MITKLVITTNLIKFKTPLFKTIAPKQKGTEMETCEMI